MIVTLRRFLPDAGQVGWRELEQEQAPRWFGERNA